MSDSPDLSINPLFEIIEPEVDDQRQFTILIGYIAEATEDTVKVYPTLDLRSYLEIPRDDIVWAEKEVPGQESSPTRLVIKCTACVTRVTSAARRVEEGFLSGLITSENLTTAAPGVTVEVKVAPEVPSATCPPPPAHPAVAANGATAPARTHCWATGVCFSDLVH